MIRRWPLLKYIVAFYLSLIIVESVFVLAVGREPNKVENILLWPVTKVLELLNLGLKKINN